MLCIFINKYDISIAIDDWNSDINTLYNKIDLYSTQHSTIDVWRLLSGNCVSLVTRNTQTYLAEMSLVNWLNSFVLYKFVFHFLYCVCIYLGCIVIICCILLSSGTLILYVFIIFYFSILCCTS